jgi:2,4-dienoyl-CoA reductase-like NADH-dependent reductase (Old Yellow Enzyme family)
MSRARWQKLLSPGQIGTMEVKNRIVMPGYVIQLGLDGHFVSDALRDFCEARAKERLGRP